MRFTSAILLAGTSGHSYDSSVDRESHVDSLMGTKMMDLMSDPAVKAGLAILVLIVLSAIAFFLVSRLRDYTAKDWDHSSLGLSNFQEMRLKGDISDEEFRTIQAAAQASEPGDETAAITDSLKDGDSS